MIRALSTLALLAALCACDTTLWLGNLREATAPADSVGADSLSDALAAVPCIVATPDRIDFQTLAADASATRSLTLHNLCDTPRTLRGFYLGGDRGFAVSIGVATYPLSLQTGTDGVRFAAPLALGPDSSLPIGVAFVPTAPEPARASIIWLTDDTGGGPTVQLLANSRPPPCLATFPKSVDFGPVIVGTQRQRTLRVGSCGSAALVVSELALEGPDAASFSLTPPVSFVVPPAPDGLDLGLRFASAPAASTQAGDLPPSARATLVIASNAFRPSVPVAVSAIPVASACPWPVIASGLPESVAVGEPLAPDSSQSLGVLAPVDRRAWTATGPGGARARFAPSPDAAAPTVRLDVVGTWTLALAVWDADGRPGCAVAQRVIEVLPPPSGVYIQLTWETPGDLDPTDRGPGAGSDLDLHVRHPLATGEDIDGDGLLDGWFDQPFDVHWRNPRPDWGQLGDPSDDPRLTLDDTDGAGPEAVDLPRTAGDGVYTVGAQSWDDHGYGSSLATLAVWLDGGRLGDVPAVAIQPGRFCTLATLELPAATLTPSPDIPCPLVTLQLQKSVP